MKIRDRIKELKRVPASDLLPNPKNWRTHPAAQADALRGVLGEVGFADAVLARETENGLMLIDGHLRAEVAPDASVPVLVLDVTQDEADKILATHDPLAAMATTDAGQLADLLEGMRFDSDAAEAMVGELAKAEGVTQSAEIVEDEVPEPPADPVTQPGDLWTLGDHRVLCGDCRNGDDVATLLGGSKVNLAFTSPPYASQRKYDETTAFKPIPPGDYVDWFESVQANVQQHLANDGSWFVNIKPCADGLDTSLYVFDLVCAHVRNWGWHFATEFCWERMGIPQQVTRRFKNQFEPIFQFAMADWKIRPETVRHPSENVPKAMGVGAGDTHAAKRQGTGACAVEGNDLVPGFAFPGNRIPPHTGSHAALGHAAAFPVGLPSFFIAAYTDGGDHVYDPFLGSGTTLIAAEQLGRKCYGLEISPAYCDVIVNRWESLTGRKGGRHGARTNPKADTAEGPSRRTEQRPAKRKRARSAKRSTAHA